MVAFLPRKIQLRAGAVEHLAGHLGNAGRVGQQDHEEPTAVGPDAQRWGVGQFVGVVVNARAVAHGSGAADVDVHALERVLGMRELHCL